MDGSTLRDASLRSTRAIAQDAADLAPDDPDAHPHATALSSLIEDTIE